MMFKILMDFLTRIVGKLSLVKRVNYMQRVNFDEKNPIHLSLLSRVCKLFKFFYLTGKSYGLD